MQVCPVQSLVQVQENPIGFSTQVAPFIHGDDKQACSTDENGVEKTEGVTRDRITDGDVKGGIQGVNGVAQGAAGCTTQICSEVGKIN